MQNKINCKFRHILTFLSCIALFQPLSADSGYGLWLKHAKLENVQQCMQLRSSVTGVVVNGSSETAEIIAQELKTGLSGLTGKDIPLVDSVTDSGLWVGTLQQLSRISDNILIPSSLTADGFMIRNGVLNGHPVLIITGHTEISLLYGSFHLLRLLQNQQPLDDIYVVSNPKIKFRLLNHWDNPDRSVERGYAGKSLWKWDELPDQVDPRYTDYARANASLGINGAVINNVNADPVFLTAGYIEKLARLAEVFRPYGIQIYLSVNFASPLADDFTLEGNRRGGIGDLETADPVNPEVIRWWKEKVDQIYQQIPDFGGFLVKASSEGMPGPQDYERSHAAGANMLAHALAPHGGIVMWRAFVYDAETDPDRAKRAWKEFVPLDGAFDANVFVQAKTVPSIFNRRNRFNPYSAICCRPH
ncbi:MAG: alpha-glucuronidase family glycosyl hydrolase [candidate division KSB1 bacterium]|nr:alpha-glucuronidase family glycosyl hydrolase [candidate division KSB1 bacterium]